jgi:uncharacterized protein YndB with AHSA1/START domain/predicted SnoaL-like aldol condensation-catalyzing enzyme
MIMSKTESSNNREKTEFVIDRERKVITMTRTFNAPRELVFRAYTDPDLIPKWWGPRAYTTIVDKMEFRVGGTWRFINVTPDGKEYRFHGEYKEISPPGRLVYSFEFEGAPGHISIEEVVLEDRGRGRTTKVTDTISFGSVEELEAMAKSGMEEGARESMDRFAELVEQEDFQKREKHKAIVVEFFELIAQGKPRDSLDFFSQDSRQHNPYTRGGMGELLDAIAAVQKEEPSYPDQSFVVKKIFAEGDMVAAHTEVLNSKSDLAKGGLRQVHLFRFGKDEKIVEYWDLTQAIVPDMPNAANAF